MPSSPACLEDVVEANCDFHCNSSQMPLWALLVRVVGWDVAARQLSVQGTSMLGGVPQVNCFERLCEKSFLGGKADGVWATGSSQPALRNVKPRRENSRLRSASRPRDEEVEDGREERGRREAARRLPDVLGRRVSCAKHHSGGSSNGADHPSGGRDNFGLLACKRIGCRPHWRLHGQPVEHG